MGRLGDWDKVEKKRRAIKYTRSDELWDYFKMFLIFAVLYLLPQLQNPCLLLNLAM